MTYYLKNYTRFKFCGTESLLLIYIPFCFLEREEKGTALMLGAVSDFYLNVIQGIHLDKKKTEVWLQSEQGMVFNDYVVFHCEEGQTF